MIQSLEQQALVGMELAELREVLGREQPSFRARQLFDALYRRQVADLSEISVFPQTLRNQLVNDQNLGHLFQEQCFRSADGTIRYLLRLQDNRTVETVLMPEADRDTICISSQVGCPVDCRFCLTALMGFERNLTAGEIVGQVLFVARKHQLRPRDGRLNIVMMGMGEPLLNLDQVLKATRLLTDSDGIGLSPKRITISTSGIIPKMEELGQAQIRPKLAISLNASTEQERRALMPITRKYHLADLLEACRRYPLRSWEKLTFEYVLLAGVNDSDADAHRVVKLLARIDCKVNVISLNPGPGISFEPPSPDRVQRFQEIIRRRVPCFLRKPRGLDIFAACGQLKRIAPNLIELGAAN